jgi:GNAT superfamily N-acetyltransferase
MTHEILEITFEEILTMWEFLYPNRNHKMYVKMVYKDKNAKWTLSEDQLNITFLGKYVKNKLCGVNSLHLTPNNIYRSRGLYVLPEYRRKGFGESLLKHTIQKSKDYGGDGIWSYPRNTALSVYTNAGFIKDSEFENGEWGVNCYVNYVVRR